MKATDLRYFKIKKDSINYKGNLFFAYDSGKDQVLQVRESVGERTGKHKMIGAYYIHRLTFLSNYYEFYLEEISEQIFINAFDRVCRKLRNYTGK